MKVCGLSHCSLDLRSRLRSQRRHARTTFTLIELLVVVAIVAVLVAVLLPALGMAREKARAISCANGTRQIGMAISVYADDCGGLLPSPFTNNGAGNGGMLFVLGGLWNGKSYLTTPSGSTPGERLGRPPFFHGVLWCPTASGQATGITPTGAQYVSYGPSCFWCRMEPDWAGTPDPSKVLVSKKLYDPKDRFVTSFDPATFWLISEFSPRHDLWSEPYIRCISDSPDPLWEGYDLNLRVHSGGTNFLFADGRGAWFPKSVIVARYNPLVQSYTRFQPEMR